MAIRGTLAILSKRWRSLAATTFILSMLAPTVDAQNLIYSVPGLQSGGGLGTYISCTNFGNASNSVTVNVLDGPGATICTGILTLNTNETGTFGTSSAAGIFINADMKCTLFGNGSAQVLAESKQGLICAAFIADFSSLTPVSMVALPVISKTKQKGD